MTPQEEEMLDAHAVGEHAVTARDGCPDCIAEGRARTVREENPFAEPAPSGPGMDTYRLRLEVAALVPESPQEVVLEAMARVDRLKAEVKEISCMLEEGVIAWIKERGDLVAGDIRYYVGPDKTTKLTDPVGAVQQLVRALLPGGLLQPILEQALETAGGDIEGAAELVTGTLDAALARFATEVLAANGLKPGTARDLLGNQWGEVFTEKADDGLKEGKPKREKVQKVDAKFTKPRARKTAAPAEVVE